MIVVAAATGVADVLVALFVVLLAAKLGDELFKRLGQPAGDARMHARGVDRQRPLAGGGAASAAEA